MILIRGCATIHGINRNRSTICISLWSEQQQVEKLPIGQEIDIRFKLPGDQPESSLSKRPPIYWELELRAKSSGIDYQAIFTVPIYKKKVRRKSFCQNTLSPRRTNPDQDLLRASALLVGEIPFAEQQPLFPVRAFFVCHTTPSPSQIWAN